MGFRLLGAAAAALLTCCWAGCASDAGGSDAESDYAVNSARRDWDRERELFRVLERAMLAPRRGAVVGGVGETAGLVVERVGAFETDDLCAAAAMAEHAKKSRAVRGLALGAPKLFDAVARRLSRAVFEATYPHPALRRRKARQTGARQKGSATEVSAATRLRCRVPSSSRLSSFP